MCDFLINILGHIREQICALHRYLSVQKVSHPFF